MIVESLPVGMVIALQSDGEVIYANREASQVLGLPLERIKIASVGQSVQLLRLDGEPFPVHELATIKAKNSGREERATFGVVQADGSVRWVATRAVPMTLEDGTAVIVTSSIGITDVIRAQQERMEMAMLQEQFVANVSHELRTPLNIVLGYASLAVMDSTAVDDRAWQKVNMAAGRMRWLIERFLGVAKLEAGADIPFELFDLMATVIEVVEGMEIIARQHGVTLTMGTMQAVACVGCEPLLALIIGNLIHNAIKFSPNGSVVVSVEVNEGGASVIVADNGIGMTPETQAIIFEKFRQGDGSDRRRFGGTGIGLYFVKLVADLHGGWVDVESKLGVGSAFSLRLPW